MNVQIHRAFRYSPAQFRNGQLNIEKGNAERIAPLFTLNTVRHGRLSAYAALKQRGFQLGLGLDAFSLFVNRNNTDLGKAH